jgi:hypothetical protein
MPGDMICPSIEKVKGRFNVDKLKDIADDKQRYNERCRTYQFFAKDL